MPVSDTDLLLVQRGNQPYKADASEISSYVRNQIDVSGPSGDIPVASASQLGVIRVGTNLDIDSQGVLSAVIPAGLSYQGPWSDAANPPTSLADGYFWIWEGADATLNNALWGTANGDAVTEGDRLFYEGGNFAVISGGGGGGLTEITGTAPVVVSAITDGEQDVSMPAASAGNDGYMPSELFTKLEGIEAGAEANVDPTQTYAIISDVSGGFGGTLTLSPGGDTTDIPIATETSAGLMSGADKAQLDSLVSTPGGVASLTARNGITNSGTSTSPVLDIDFGALPNGDATTAQVMPYDISALPELG